eukprot:m.515186 g.515186  ORF g.515186 m.515186 type:complete len:155 (+) comp57461_c0_seq2:2450-2914(+)
MWTSEQFREHLAKEGRPDLWSSQIYPSMKEIAVNTCKSVQDIVTNRKNSFELYGIDFMLDEDYHVWLIEVNSSPCLEHSTAVTARMCPEVIEDTIKVVVDRKKNKKADIGSVLTVAPFVPSSISFTPVSIGPDPPEAFFVISLSLNDLATGSWQ